MPIQEQPRPSNDQPFTAVPPPPPPPIPTPVAAPEFHCRNCGAEIQPAAKVCIRCGLVPTQGNSFCSSCGATTRPAQVVCLTCGSALTPVGTSGASEKNKMAAGLLAIFLGALGIHKFYLGYSKAGAIMLVVTIVGSFLFGLGALAMAIIGLIEGIFYLSKSDAEFENTYVKAQKQWF
jgi:TM2 domain-containing membrane protein YozV